MYKNEDTLGQGIKAFCHDQVEPFFGDQTLKYKSLQKLGLAYVDLFLIHDPTPHQNEGRLKEIWTQMELVRGEGLLERPTSK